ARGPEGSGPAGRGGRADPRRRVHRVGRGLRRGRGCGMGGPPRRVLAPIRKESLQIRRDPSAFLIAGVLPLLLLVIFGYGVSLDLRRVPVAVVVEAPTPEAASLLSAYRNSRYFTVREARHRIEVEADLVAGRVSGIVVLASDFAERLGRGETAPVQVIVDGGDPN